MDNDGTHVARPSILLQAVIWGGLLGIVVVIAVFGTTKKNRLPVYTAVPAFAFTNQNGQPFSGTALGNHPWVADIIFTRCPTQCLRMSRLMSQLQDALPSQVHLVSLTADPAFDTPPILKRYGARFQARDDRWTFLTGTKTDLYRFAIDGLKLSVDEKAQADRESLDDLFIHSSRFALVDGKGKIRGWFDGDQPESLVKLKAAVNALKLEH